MNTIDSFRRDIPGSGWQMIGEIELPARARVKEILSAWLIELLHPLPLPVEFIERILLSAQDAVEHAFEAEPDPRFEHVHLLVYAPQDRELNGQSWGFFRIEKLENTDPGKSPSDHAIEFYLYRDGQ